MTKIVNSRLNIYYLMIRLNNAQDAEYYMPDSDNINFIVQDFTCQGGVHSKQEIKILS